MAIIITISSDATAGLRSRTSLLRLALLRGVGKATIGVQADVVQNKLHGQVLNQVTGNLARNVIAQEPTVSGDVVEGIVGVGSTAWYGKVHEFGTTGSFDIFPKNKKALRWVSGGKVFFAKHVTHPPFKERSFLRSSLAECEADGRIRAWIEGPIREALSL